MSLNKPKIIVIIGPTASGKTALGLALARMVGGEIINADSRQFYRGCDIGTSKSSPAERQGIAHHLIDFLEPNERSTASDYVQKARDVISNCVRRGVVPIIVGGTGLYISALIENYQFSGRGGKSKGEAPYDVFLIAPAYERAQVYERINARVDVMISAGLADEVKGLADRYGWEAPAMLGIGYRQLRPYLENDVPLPDVIDTLKKETRNFAKRQITWFKRYEGGIHYYKNAQDARGEIVDWLKVC